MAKAKAILPSLDRVMAAVRSDEFMAFCVACGDEAYGLEPDTRAEPCEACGKKAVFGAQELLLRMVA